MIQTHGFDPKRFWIDGPWPTAFAAQALAAHGIVVLQVREGYEDLNTPKEAERVMGAYEGAIDELDRMGLIDRTHVGIIGFSRTSFYVKYTLTHSSYPFAAAVVADGIDAGYFQYITYANAIPSLAAHFESINDGLPYGIGMPRWFKHSPGFLLDKVRTPVLIEAIGRAGLLNEWEWFSGLSRLGKQVHLIYIPDGDHVLEKPWERLTSQEQSVDWLCFWLKGEKNSLYAVSHRNPSSRLGAELERKSSPDQRFPRPESLQ